jgi:hypothetical protein
LITLKDLILFTEFVFPRKTFMFIKESKSCNFKQYLNVIVIVCMSSPSTPIKIEQI